MERRPGAKDQMLAILQEYKEHPQRLVEKLLPLLKQRQELLEQLEPGKVRIERDEIDGINESVDTLLAEAGIKLDFFPKVIREGHPNEELRLIERESADEKIPQRNIHASFNDPFVLHEGEGHEGNKQAVISWRSESERANGNLKREVILFKPYGLVKWDDYQIGVAQFLVEHPDFIPHLIKD
jgi:hypothetical protein